ncbi:MAG: type-F conjugative transfer system secretin TraK [Alphaproteobacteria bacterium]|nr:type-F conjugative transfer system secretin TraK [Alphaproteobacteria bacterium]
MKKFIFMALYSFLATNVHAIQKYHGSVDPVQIVISKKHLCRMYVEGDRIQKIIGSTDFLSIEFDEDVGHIWVSSYEMQKEPIIVTIITEKGYIQDLKILTSEKPCETIAFIPIKNKEDKKVKSDREEIISVIKAILKNKNKEGYIPYENPPNRGGYNGIIFTPLRAYKGRQFMANLYSIKNTLTYSQIIRETAFCGVKCMAASSLKSKLEPNENTSLVIVERISDDKNS